jgi:hypothetical protein
MIPSPTHGGLPLSMHSQLQIGLGFSEMLKNLVGKEIPWSGKIIPLIFSLKITFSQNPTH